MENEKELSHNESLALITSMINQAKERFGENGFLYLLWGWGILICCIAQFILQQVYSNDSVYAVWSLIWLLLIYQIFYLRKKKKQSDHRSYTDELYGYVWAAFGISIFLTLIVCGMFGQFQMINPIILILYGIPSFLSGALLRFRPLLVGGIACWVLALISPFVNERYAVLLIALAIVIAWIIPGYLLRIRYKKQLSYG